MSASPDGASVAALPPAEGAVRRVPPGEAGGEAALVFDEGLFAEVAARTAGRLR